MDTGDSFSLDNRHFCRSFFASRFLCEAVGISDKREGGTVAIQSPRVNRRIRIPQVRVINDDGEQLGVIPTSEALAMAEERGLDLVEVSPKARPPVCKIMDYGKYMYQLNKRAKEAKKRQHVTVVKEVKMRPKIEPHDYDFKVRHAQLHYFDLVENSSSQMIS